MSFIPYKSFAHVSSVYRYDVDIDLKTRQLRVKLLYGTTLDVDTLLHDQYKLNMTFEINNPEKFSLLALRATKDQKISVLGFDQTKDCLCSIIFAPTTFDEKISYIKIECSISSFFQAPSIMSTVFISDSEFAIISNEFTVKIMCIIKGEEIHELKFLDKVRGILTNSSGDLMVLCSAHNCTKVYYYSKGQFQLEKLEPEKEVKFSLLTGAHTPINACVLSGGYFAVNFIEDDKIVYIINNYGELVDAISLENRPCIIQCTPDGLGIKVQFSMHDESGKTISVLCIVPKDENIYISLVEKTSDSRGKDTLAHDKSTGDYAHFFKKHASSVGVFSAGLVAGCALARHYCSK